ncbi:MAG: SDR family oxidoreductase [Bacteroidota bacterium]
MTLRTVSVLGCGWLGLPLAERLVQRGLTVRGSTTSPGKLDRLAEAGIVPHRIAVTESVEGEDLAAFFGADVLVVTVPPSKGGASYPAVFRAIRSAAETHGTGWVVMMSSTSVYPNLDRVVTEADAGARDGLPLRRAGAPILEAERVLQASEQFDATVLRLAGLYGGDRHPARVLAGRTGIAGGDAPVNLVHRDDAVGAALFVLERGVRGEAVNVCADEHPARQHLYPAVARALGLDPPTFEDGMGDGFKVVSNEKLRRLGFAFHRPDPMEAAETA